MDCCRPSVQLESAFQPSRPPQQQPGRPPIGLRTRLWFPEQPAAALIGGCTVGPHPAATLLAGLPAARPAPQRAPAALARCQGQLQAFCWLPSPSWHARAWTSKPLCLASAPGCKGGTVVADSLTQVAAAPRTLSCPPSLLSPLYPVGSKTIAHNSHAGEGGALGVWSSLSITTRSHQATWCCHAAINFPGAGMSTFQ